MTRKEEIKKSVQEFIEERKTAIGRVKRGGWYFANIFEEGIKWADEHPKSSWISILDDLPCNHEEMIINADSLSPITKKVLIYNKNKEIRVSWMLYLKDKGWVWDISAYSQPLFFMFIPELPKE